MPSPTVVRTSVRRRSTVVRASGFDPAVHLCPGVAEEVKMSDIGLSNDTGISQTAVCGPFRLFSEGAIAAIRSEVLNPGVTSRFSFSSNINPKQIRGCGPEHAPFTFAAWKHQDTLDVISTAAGIDLVPAMDYEIGHVNISIPGQANGAVVDWHLDSYPFVCVLMLSDCSKMIGGETEIKTGNGDTVKARGPGRGYAVVLQGRYLTHRALRAVGGQERITMVTSFRPKSPFVRDDTALASVRPVSNLPELYGQYAGYRIDIAMERAKQLAKEVEKSLAKKEPIDSKKLRSWLEEMEEFFRHTKEQLVDEELVTAGVVDT